MDPTVATQRKLPGPAAAVLFRWEETTVDDAERAALALGGVLRGRGLPTAAVPPGAAGSWLLTRHVHDLGLPAALRVAVEREWAGLMGTLGARLRPGVELVLHELARRSIPVGVLSRWAPEVVDADLRRHRLSDLVTAVHPGIPAPEVALAAYAARHGRERVVFVSCSARDLVAGHRAGATTVGVARDERTREALAAARADRTISQLGDLVPLIDNQATSGPRSTFTGADTPCDSAPTAS